MNQKKLKVSSNNIKHRHKVLQSYFIRVFTLIFLFIFCDVSMANNEDYMAYVNAQAQKSKDSTAPYKTEVDAIVKNRLSKKKLRPLLQPKALIIVATLYQTKSRS